MGLESNTYSLSGVGVILTHESTRVLSTSASKFLVLSSFDMFSYS
jgi:hypothetical protein